MALFSFCEPLFSLYARPRPGFDVHSPRSGLSSYLVAPPGPVLCPESPRFYSADSTNLELWLRSLVLEANKRHRRGCHTSSTYRHESLDANQVHCWLRHKSSNLVTNFQVEHRALYGTMQYLLELICPSLSNDD